MTQDSPTAIPAPASGPPTPPPGQKTGNGLGLASLIIGIVALLGAAIPIVNYVSGFVAFVGLVLGVIALFLKNRSRKAAIAGTALNLVALILSIVLAVVYTAGFVTGVTNAVEDAESSRAPLSESTEPAGPTQTLLLEVTGDAPDASIGYATSSDLADGTAAAADQPLPFTKEVQVPAAGEFAVQVQSLTATTGADDTGAITCRITLDGEVIAEQTSTGAFAAAFCMGTSK